MATRLVAVAALTAIAVTTITVPLVLTAKGGNSATPYLSTAPSTSPTFIPTDAPTIYPTVTPSLVPSKRPTEGPTIGPSHIPTGVPTSLPSTSQNNISNEIPTTDPTSEPTNFPTSFVLLQQTPVELTTIPSTENPSGSFTQSPTVLPVAEPSNGPTGTQPQTLVPTLQVSSLVPSTQPPSPAPTVPQISSPAPSTPPASPAPTTPLPSPQPKTSPPSPQPTTPPPTHQPSNVPPTLRPTNQKSSPAPSTESTTENDNIFSSDPTCSTGIQSNDICCPTGCGDCGGSGCSSAPLGPSSCCTSSILDSGRSCNDNPPPCAIMPKVELDATNNPPGDPTCSTGIPSNKVCCPSGCGDCGGEGCSNRPLGAFYCCGSSILGAGLSCNEYLPPCGMMSQEELDATIDPIDLGAGSISSVEKDIVDPFCSSGLRAESGACCPKECGSCGGDDDSDCALRGGNYSCCAISIVRSRPSCEVAEAPCYTNITSGIGFEHLPPGTPLYGNGDLVTVKSGCGVPSDANNNNDNNNCMEAIYEPMEQGTERLTGLTPVPPALEYTLNFDVKFEEGFQFVKGGKLHGLGPANHISGCGPMSDTGWSARVMWSTGGRPIIYVYHQDKDDYCGHAFPSNVPLTPGIWETISLFVRVNSESDVFDGLVRLYLNGQVVAEALDLRFVDDPAWAAPHSEGLIANFMFSTFHGGSDASWAPDSPQRAYFDNIAILPGEQVRNSTYSTATVRSGNKLRAKSGFPSAKSYKADSISCRDKWATSFEEEFE